MWPTWTFSLAAAALAFAAIPAQAYPARGIVVQPDGTVVFSDLERVWSVDSRGRLRRVLDHPGQHTHALALDPTGAVVGETSQYRSHRLSPRVATKMRVRRVDGGRSEVLATGTVAGG